jgi:hypothetical protein
MHVIYVCGWYWKCVDDVVVSYASSMVDKKEEREKKRKIKGKEEIQNEERVSLVLAQTPN